MILSKALNARAQAVQPVDPQPVSYGMLTTTTRKTKAGPVVTPESAMSIATAYRAKNILSDGIAKMPLQLFQQVGEQKIRILPDSKTRNNPYLLEVNPNRWGWTPFLFKKNLADWLILHGNALVWSPPVWPFEKYLLPADTTYPVFDEDGDLWYATILPDLGRIEYIPGAEVMHVMINPDRSGQWGRGVIAFARETMGRQLGAYDAESQLFGQGLTPAAIMQVNATLDEDGREQYRKSYGEVMNGEGPRLAVLDNRIAKFEPVTMKLVDAQFLQLIEASDKDIANFFGIPQHMLNMGSEAYNSNEQKYLEWLNEGLDPYLVQIEQAARIKWLPANQQGDRFYKFNRNATLRMTAKERAETNEILIRSMQRSPDETRAKDDYSPIPDGSGKKFYMTKNYADVQEIGAQDAPV